MAMWVSGPGVYGDMLQINGNELFSGPGNGSGYSMIYRSNNTGGIQMIGGNAWNAGGNVFVNGNGMSSDAGSVQLATGQSTSNFDWFDHSQSNRLMNLTDAGNLGIGYQNPLTPQTKISSQW